MDAAPTKRINVAVPIIMGLVVFAVCAVAFIAMARSIGPLSPTDVNGIALRYAQQQMVWIKGPTVQSSYILPMRRLPVALKDYAPARLRSDVNAPDLIRRFGRNRQIGMVLVRGTYNTLPPDEGVVVTADVVVLVDVKAKKGIFLTD